MTAFIIRRLLYTIPIVFGVLLLTFFLFSVIGGDISYQIAGKNADAQTIAEIRHEYGLDKPLFIGPKGNRLDSQFFHHFFKAVTFQFGYDLNRELIIERIARGVMPSLALTVPMFIGTLAISIALALVSAFMRGSALDAILVVVCVAGMSIPYLSFIIFGQYVFAYQLDWFPIFYVPDKPIWHSVALPCLIGIAAGLGGSLRFYRTVMLDEMRNDYVRTAFAKGLSVSSVLFKHVLKNAMIPIVTNVVLSIPYLVLGSLLLERFFGIPGLGDLMVQAINSRDYFVLNAITYMMSLLIVIFTLLTDLCYAWVDPRVSLE